MEAFQEDQLHEDPAGFSRGTLSYSPQGPRVAPMETLGGIPLNHLRPRVGGRPLGLYRYKFCSPEYIVDVLEMSMFLCPLCGKQVSQALYDPSDYEKDVIAITKRSLGRGKGFEEIERYSLLETDSPVLDKLADRVALLADLLGVKPDQPRVLIDVDEVAGLCVAIEEVLKHDDWEHYPVDSPWEALKERVLYLVFTLI
jgi:hypothetical protein